MRIRNNKSIYHGMQTTNQDKLSVEVEPFYHYILHFTFYKLLHSQRTTRYSRLEARLQILTKQKTAISPSTHPLDISHKYTSHIALILLSYGSYIAHILLSFPDRLLGLANNWSDIVQHMLSQIAIPISQDCQD